MDFTILAVVLLIGVGVPITLIWMRLSMTPMC